MATDIEIARQAKMKPIGEIATRLGIPDEALEPYGRTKATNLAEYRTVMDLHANSSNNTLYADADGNIAFFFTNFMPKRDPKFEWNRPVDGSDPATDWKGVHTNDEVPNAINLSSEFLPAASHGKSFEL